MQIEHDLGLPDFKDSRQAEEFAARLVMIFRYLNVLCCSSLTCIQYHWFPFEEQTYRSLHLLQARAALIMLSAKPSTLVYMYISNQRWCCQSISDVTMGNPSCRQAVVLQKDLDQKERGIADGLIALAASALITAWKLESNPRSPTYLLKVDCLLYSSGTFCL